jgi:hypothetical protein
MIVVTAVHSGSGLILSASNGTTIVSPDSMAPVLFRNHLLLGLASTLPFARTT